MPEQSQGEQYQEIESKFFSYQTAKRINDQTKDLRKKKGKTSPSFIDEVDNKTTKIKKNVDSFTRNIENSEEEINLEASLDCIHSTNNRSIKKVKINQVPKSITYFAGKLKSVLFTPADLDTLFSSSSVRRKYLDTIF